MHCLSMFCISVVSQSSTELDTELHGVFVSVKLSRMGGTGMNDSVLLCVTLFFHTNVNQACLVWFGLVITIQSVRNKRDKEKKTMQYAGCAISAILSTLDEHW